MSSAVSVTVDSRSSGTGNSLPTISSASWRAVTSLGFDRAHRRASPDHRDLVGDGQHLVELVRDEQHGKALGLELAQVGEQLVDLLRNEHRGRLVQDEDACTAVEHLADLDALPVTDTEVLDQLVGSMSRP